MDRRDALGALGAVGALSVTGCLRLQEEGGAGGASALPEGVSYPTGVSEDRVSPAVAQAHRHGVTGIDVELDWSVTGELGTNNDESMSVRMGEERAVAEYEVRDIGPIDVHATPEGGIWRFVPEGEPVYGTLADRDPLVFVTREDRIAALVGAGDWGAPTYDANSETFTVEADGVDEAGPLAEALGASGVEAFSGTMEIDQWNRILDLSTEYEYRLDGDLFPETASLTTADVESGPDEPDWVADGRENRPAVDLSVAEDRRHVRIAMREGVVPTQGVRIDFRTRERDMPVPLGEPLRPGDELFLAVVDGSPVSTRDESRVRDGDRSRLAELTGPVSVTAAWILSYFHVSE